MQSIKILLHCMRSLTLGRDDCVYKASQLREFKSSLALLGEGSYVEFINSTLCIVQLLSAYLQIVLLKL